MIERERLVPFLSQMLSIRIYTMIQISMIMGTWERATMGEIKINTDGEV